MQSERSNGTDTSFHRTYFYYINRFESSAKSLILVLGIARVQSPVYTICHGPLPSSTVNFTLVPATVFLRHLPASAGKMTPRHISSSRAYSNKIPTAIPIFSGSNLSTVLLQLSCDIDICQKSKTSVVKLNVQMLRL